MLKIKRRRFFKLLAKYRKNPDNFSIQYARKTINRKIDTDIERNIVKELKIEKDLIKNKEVPVKYYNYSYLKDLLGQKYDQKVSLPTIIDRAKRNNFYFLRPKRKAHDKEVLTNYPGELIQHDSSHHRFASYAANKWYLITSLDDYSRFLLYASLVERETTWEHIWSEPLRLDTLRLNTLCIPESYSLPITSRIPLEADTPKRNATSYYYTHLQ